MTVVRSGAVSCTFDSGVNQGDYVQASSTINGLCRDAGSTYPTSNQIIGVALSSSNSNSTGTSQTIFFFDAEVRGAGATGGTYTIGASSTSPLTNSTIVCPCLSLYFVTSGATVTLPPASTAGQTLILMNVDATGAASFAKPPSGATIQDEQDGTAISSSGTMAVDGDAFFISDGNGHWYTLYKN